VDVTTLFPVARQRVLRRFFHQRAQSLLGAGIREVVELVEFQRGLEILEIGLHLLHARFVRAFEHIGRDDRDQQADDDDDDHDFDQAEAGLFFLHLHCSSSRIRYLKSGSRTAARRGGVHRRNRGHCAGNHRIKLFMFTIGSSTAMTMKPTTMAMLTTISGSMIAIRLPSVISSSRSWFTAERDSMASSSRRASPLPTMCPIIGGNNSVGASARCRLPPPCTVFPTWRLAPRRRLLVSTSPAIRRPSSSGTPLEVRMLSVDAKRAVSI